MLSHTTLSGYYEETFFMKQLHGWSLEELDNLIPFEKDIYFSMLMNFLEAVKAKRDK